MNRILGVALNLAAQVGDVNAQVLAVLFSVGPPDFAQHLAMRDDAPGMAHEQA